VGVNDDEVTVAKESTTRPRKETLRGGGGSEIFSWMRLKTMNEYIVWINHHKMCVPF
jgi:hypothetical protein